MFTALPRFSLAGAALVVVPVMLVGGFVPAAPAAPADAVAPFGPGLSEGLGRDTPAPEAVSLVVNDAVHYDGCAPVPFEYSFDPSGYADWQARVTFTDLTRGQLRTPTFVLASTTDEASGSSEVLFCDDERRGRWAASIYVQFFDDTGRETGRGSGDDRFLLLQPQTRTFFTLSDSSPNVGQLVAFRIRSEVEEPGRFGVNGLSNVVLQSLSLRSGRWTRLRGSLNETNARGVARFRMKWRSDAPVKIRAATLETTDLARSISQARRVR